MKLIVINPATGSDAAPGDHPQRAIKTCAKLNTLIAALAGSCCDVIIDTSDTPSSAPFLAVDATIQITQPGIAVYGIGHRNVGRSAPQPVPATGYADILDAKILTNANFTQPNAGTYPNVWQTADTEARAGFSELRGWTGNNTPLLVYTRVRVSTQAAALPLVNTTAGSCWTDGTTMIFHPADGSNPTTNGKTYVRSRPSTHSNTSPGAGASPLMYVGADDIRMFNVAIGGALACDYTGGTDVNEYALAIGPQGPGRTILIDGLIAHSSSWHLWGIVDESQAGAVNGSITVRNAYWSGFDPTSTSSTEPFAIFYGGAGASGSTVTMTNVKADDAVANGNSLFTHGGTNCYDLTVNYPQFTSPIGSATAACRNLKVIGSVASGSTVGNDGDASKINCLTALWQGLILPTPPSNSQITNPNTIRGCLIRPNVDAPGGLTNAGNIDIQFCTFDVVNMPGGSGSTPSLLNAMTGANTIIFGNNVVLGASSKDFDLFILAPSAFTLGTNLTLTADYNQYAFRVNFGTMFAINGGLKTPAQWQGLGFDTHSSFTYVGLATESTPASLSLGSDYFPLSTSPVVGSANATSNVGDAMGQTRDLRTTAGMYEYWPRDLARAAALMPLPATGNFGSSTMGDLVGAMLDDRIALARRIATVAADLGGAAGSLSASDPTAATVAANLNATVSSRSTYAGTDTSGTTTLLTRIPGTIAAQTGDSFARLGVPAGASVSADIAAVKSDTGNLISRLGAWTGSGVNTVLGAFRALANKMAGLTPTDLTSGGGTFDNTTDSTEAIADSSGNPADAVLNAAASSYDTAGTIGAKINAAGASGDPLANPVPGSYASGTAGHVLGQFTFDAADNVYANARVGVPTIGGNVPTSQSPALNGQTITGAANYPFAQAITVSGEDFTSWTKLVFTVKANPSDADSGAILTIQFSNPGSGGDGLTILNGAAPQAPVTAADGSIVVNQANSSGLVCTVTLTARGMGVAEGTYFWELTPYISGAKAPWLGTGQFSVQPTVRVAAT